MLPLSCGFLIKQRMDSITWKQISQAKKAQCHVQGHQSASCKQSRSPLNFKIAGPSSACDEIVAFRRKRGHFTFRNSQSEG